MSQVRNQIDPLLVHVLNCTRICTILVVFLFYNLCKNNEYKRMHVTVAVAVAVRDIRLRGARLIRVVCVIPTHCCHHGSGPVSSRQVICLFVLL